MFCPVAPECGPSELTRTEADLRRSVQMKQPHRWAAIVVALLMATTLVIAPREGGAAGTMRPIDWVGPPEVGFGEPDLPPTGSRYLRCPEVIRLLMVGRLLPVSMLLELGAKDPALHVTVTSRSTQRSAIKK